jgi:hypothetical protein
MLFFHHITNRFSINIWASVCGDNIFGPHTIPNRLTARITKLSWKTTCLLADMPLIIRQELHFSHGILVTCRYLTQKFPGWWIGKSGRTSWPPCSPDLDPLGFYFWGYLKSSVYLTPVDDEETLCSQTVQAFRQYTTCQEFGIVKLKPVFRHEMDIWNIYCWVM